MPIRRLVFIAIALTFLSGCASLPRRKSTSEIDVYKRIPYTLRDGHRTLDIFCATCREIDNDETFPRSFSPELGDRVSYCKLDISVDPALTMGKMLPQAYKKTGMIEVGDNRFLQKDDFIKQVSSAVNASPHKSLLVLILGYKDNFEYIAIEAGYFAYMLDVDTPVLLFDWPGDQPVTPGGYLKARSLAEDSGKYLSELLTDIIRKVKPEKLWIKASSLGSQVVCNAFDEMYAHEDLRDADPEIDDVILAAPDVKEKEFDEDFRKEFTVFSRDLTVYVSSNDEALLMSGFIDGERKLGLQEPRPETPGELDEAKDILYLKSLMPERVTLIDVTPINKASYRHGYYFEAPEFFDDVYLKLFEGGEHLNRHLYLMKTKEGIDYWVLYGD